MANFTALAAARHEVLRRAGWDVEADGLQRAPRLRVVVGNEVHVSVIGALRTLGVGSREVVRVDCRRPGAHASGCAGEDRDSRGERSHDRLCSGRQCEHRRVRPVRTPIADRPPRPWTPGCTWTARSDCGPARAAPCAHHVQGVARADSWATDAHKWLNVPYDSGLAFIAHPAAHRAALSVSAAYLVRSAEEPREPMDWTPESSRRARGFTVYAALRELGRTRRRGDDRSVLPAGAPLCGSTADGAAAANPQRGRRSIRCSCASSQAHGDADRATRDDDPPRAGRARVLVGRHTLARHGCDAHLGVELVDDRSRRRSIRRIDRPRGPRVMLTDRVSFGPYNHRPEDRGTPSRRRQRAASGSAVPSAVGSARAAGRTGHATRS